MGIDLGNLAALRTFRVLRALKTVAIVPGNLHNRFRGRSILCLIKHGFVREHFRES